MVAELLGVEQAVSARSKAQGNAADIAIHAVVIFKAKAALVISM